MTDTTLPVHHYRSAGGVVSDAEGRQVLVLDRPGRMGPDGRPEVRLPKGHIEAGESREAAALREVREETGYTDLEIVADLGDRQVEFDWQGRHVVRDEAYFLMRWPGDQQAPRRPKEHQFEPRWLPWLDALVELTFRAERDAVRRGWIKTSKVWVR